MEKCYIAGPVTGIDRNKVVESFFNAAEKMRQAGFEVVNPVDEIAADSSWGDAMRISLRLLVSCDAICLLPFWHLSAGAQLEYRIAVDVGLKIIDLYTDFEFSPIGRIRKIVKQAWGLELEFLRQDTRKRDVVEYRQIAMWYLKRKSKMSQRAIAAEFGRKTTASVCHAAKTVDQLRFSNREFGEKVKDFLEAEREY
jgi:hypothetical protein